MKTIKLLFLLVVIFASCQKDEQQTFDTNSITNLTSNFTGETQTRTQLRLAFGKTVANALVHPEFRKYIKKTSETDEFKGFNEIVFALHQNDQVTEDLTLKGVLNAAIDEEVKELFGDLFLENLLEQDPLITIKLPDVFYNFDWNEENLVPMVQVKTPEFLSKPDDNYIYYQSYHHSGYGELVAPWKDLKYFSLIIKYSEDYILWENQSFQNEKGISIFEFLPQAEVCWDLIKTRIEQASIPASGLFDMKYLKKRDLFYYYQQLCEPGFNGYTESCETEPCFRDCENGEQITTFLEFVEFQPVLYRLSSRIDPILHDGMHIALPVSNSGIENFDYKKQITVIGFRKCEFFDLSYDFDLKLKKVYFENYGHLILPKIYYDENQILDNQAIRKELNVYLFSDWPIERQRLISISLENLLYDDEVTTTAIPSLFGGSWWRTNASISLFHGNINFSVCDSPRSDRKFGDRATFYLKF